MAFHDDLLEQAIQLVHKEPRKPKQASLRRAVSTAYYALFHLLVDQATANWRRADSRMALGRAFDHSHMKNASNRVLNLKFPDEKPSAIRDLKLVAKTFVKLQELRHSADYDGSVFWTRTEALDSVRSVERAFDCWKAVRKEKIAQEYLVAFLIKQR